MLRLMAQGPGVAAAPPADERAPGTALAAVPPEPTPEEPAE
jgi:hypothetical protein